jgi:putative transcriptional regulator
VEGKLLIAHPLLNDGFFNRSVIYVTNHNDEGSFGFSLNFKTEYKLRDIRPHVKNGNFPIFDGGPVGKDQLFFLHTLGNNISDSCHIKDNIYFGGDINELLHLIEHNKIKQSQVRFFSGYSGWGADQMEREIKTKSWLVNDHETDDLLLINYSDLWRQKLEEINENYGIFADIGFDPSMN